MFNLLEKHPDMKCHVSDLNSDLILAYLAIRDKVTEVIKSLENHSKKYQKIQILIIITYVSLNLYLRLKKYQD
uniref:site-specific DNA-methyltransferase (adenine-specific) n=2 Tax=environmental samples TaxID=651140 RepID=A0A075HYY0_9ARCH|nr:hypothetical protein [uncultured marine thaumarchaeote SAT1000_05_A05]AIF21581.1 hypothetical protein [uncultured marine thaumarchaeote SAT1000_05_B05]